MLGVPLSYFFLLVPLLESTQQRAAFCNLTATILGETLVDIEIKITIVYNFVFEVN